MSLSNLNDEQIEKVIQCFEDLAGYNNLERETYDEMVKQKKSYTPIIPDDICIKALFQSKIDRKITFLVGKRGAGKTTILKRVAIECLESFFIKKDLEYLKKEKMVLPVYIDLKNLFLNVLEKTSLTGDDLKDVYNLCKNLNIEFIRQIENTYDELRELGVIDNHVFLKIENIIKNQIQKLEHIEPAFSKVNDEKTKNFYSLLRESIEKISYYNQNENLLLKLKENENLNERFRNLFNLSIYKNLFDNLKSFKETPVNYVHFLIDDFSEISIINQKIIIDSFIEPLFKSFNDICFCIASYPQLYHTSSLKLKQDYQIINLDWYISNSNQTFEKRIQEGIEISTQIIFKRVNSVLPEIFRNIKHLAILFDDLNNFFRELFFLTMGTPRLIGLILTHPKNIMILKMKMKISIDRIQEASNFIYEEILYKDYFKSLLKSEKSNYYFSEQEIKMDKLIFDNLTYFMKENFMDKPNGFFIINEDLIQKKHNLLSRLETMGFVYKLEMLTESNALYCLYYGCCIQNNINFSLNEDINYWSEKAEEYDVSNLLINTYNNKSFDESLLFNQNELPPRYLKDKDDFDLIFHQLNEDQIKIIHTLYLNMDKNKGWMTTDEIGITKRIFPFSLPHIRIIRIIRSIKSHTKAKFLIGEIEKGKILYRISNMGISFEEYCAWKLKL